MDLKLVPRVTIELSHAEVKLIGMALIGAMSPGEVSSGRELNAKLMALYSRELDNFAERIGRTAENALHLTQERTEKNG